MFGGKGDQRGHEGLEEPLLRRPTNRDRGGREELVVAIKLRCSEVIGVPDHGCHARRGPNRIAEFVGQGELTDPRLIPVLKNRDRRPSGPSGE